LFRFLLGFLSVAVFVTSAGGWTIYTYFNGKIKQVTLHLGGDRPAGARGTSNYLLVGTDSRAGSGGAFGDVPGQRSDTTILVHLAADDTATMVSFPRDTYVTIPEYLDSAGRRHPEHRDKFNAAISDGGPSLLVRMVERLTDLRIDHYVSMDLEGFKAITNAIGGVAVCITPSPKKEVFLDDKGRRRVSTNTNDPMSGFVGGPGAIQVNGDQALAFVRQRHGLPGGDIDRIRRQQQFMGAVFRKATTGGVLTNPVRLEGLLSTATSALTLDDHTNIADLRKLATQMRGAAAGNLRMQTLPTHAPTRGEGAVNDNGEIILHGQRTSVLFYRPDDLEQLIAPLRGRSRSDATGPTSPSPTGTGTAAGASVVTVRVFNGTNIQGLATRAVTELTRNGVAATTAGNASTSAYVTSRVIYGAGQEASARAIQAMVPGSRLQSDPTATGVQLILGSSFTGVTAGRSVPGSPPAATRPAAPPTAMSPPPEAPSCTY
jgi:LCP family protein required for cell wall assembly